MADRAAGCDSLPVISNRDARRLWLSAMGLSDAPVGRPDVMAMIRALGFLQIDTIRNVSRAHHHILWSRNQNYREPMLWPLLGRERLLFEHFTHDASLIPMEYYPMWRRQFRRMGARVARSDWYKTNLAASSIKGIRDRIAAEGALSTHAFDSKIDGERRMWSRPPHKKALDQMWYAGELATSHRKNFVKFYDLAERVFPQQLRALDHSETAQVNWLCDGAISRLGVASLGEVQQFWAATDRAEVKLWAKERHLSEVAVEAADGSLSRARTGAGLARRIAAAPLPASRLRIINPFDPAIRDRTRLKRLFGFDYRNEMFVPRNKRRWGYYVYPLLEADRFVGRIELRAERRADQLQVVGFWPEPGVKWGQQRRRRLDSELARFARFAGIGNISWTDAP